MLIINTSKVDKPPECTYLFDNHNFKTGDPFLIRIAFFCRKYPLFILCALILYFIDNQQLNIGYQYLTHVVGS